MRLSTTKASLAASTSEGVGKLRTSTRCVLPQARRSPLDSRRVTISRAAPLSPAEQRTAKAHCKEVRERNGVGGGGGGGSAAGHCGRPAGA